MRVSISPSRAKGSVLAPPSKSMAHRALICGALSEKSTIKNLAFSKDIMATLGCLETLGANVKVENNTVEIGGLCLNNIPDNAELFVDESGSTLRFLLPLCMASGKRIKLSGSKRLFERPLGIYERIAKEQDITFQKNDNSVTVCGELSAGEYYVSGNISSQFISGLLFSLPLLSGKSKIIVTGDFESASYIALTLAVMRDFGVDVKREDNAFYIKKSEYKGARYIVEGDCSNAAFLEAFNYLDGSVSVGGLNSQTLQGDCVYKEIFEGLKKGEKQFDLSDCPDLAPVAFAVSAVYGGAVFTGTKRLRLKESDRAVAMQNELSKFGIEVDVFGNSVEIKNGKLKEPSVPLYSHNDHRIAMALSLLSSVTGGIIEGAEAVAKSYPDFYKQIGNLGIDLHEID